MCLDLVNKWKDRRKFRLDRFFISKAFKTAGKSKKSPDEAMKMLVMKAKINRFYANQSALVDQVCQREYSLANQLLMDSNKLHG